MYISLAKKYKLLVKIHNVVNYPCHFFYICHTSLCHLFIGCLIHSLLVYRSKFVNSLDAAHRVDNNLQLVHCGTEGINRVYEGMAQVGYDDARFQG